MRSGALWVVAASPLFGVAAVAFGGRLPWPRALGAAVAAGLAAAGLSLWHGGLVVGGPRDALPDPAGLPGRADYLWMLAWAGA